MRRTWIVLACVAASFVVPSEGMASPPGNDHRADARSIDAPFTESVSLVEATREVDEPVASCGQDGSTVWYEYVPAEAIPVTVEAIGRYSNGSYAAVYVVDDDEPTEVICATWGGAVGFVAELGSVYLIQVGGGGYVDFTLGIGVAACTYSPAWVCLAARYDGRRTRVWSPPWAAFSVAVGSEGASAEGGFLTGLWPIPGPVGVLAQGTVDPANGASVGGTVLLFIVGSYTSVVVGPQGGVVGAREVVLVCPLFGCTGAGAGGWKDRDGGGRVYICRLDFNYEDPWVCLVDVPLP